MNPTREPDSRRIARNCRSLRRFLTRPWQDEQGRLFHYDFDTDAFEWSPSSSLVTEDGANTPEVEAWLAATLECPVSAIRPRLTREDPTALDDWPFFKAAVLMIWLQGGWFHAAVDEDVRQDMSRLAAMPTDELDGLIAAAKDDVALRLVFTTSSGTSMAPLFVPASGIFPFALSDTRCISGHSIGVGLPLDVHCAVVMLPADTASETDLSLLIPVLSNCSIGSAESKRVVLPPNLLGAMAERDAAQILKGQREQSEARVSEVRDVRQTLLETFESIGVRAQIDRMGRIMSPST